MPSDRRGPSKTFFPGRSTRMDDSDSEDWAVVTPKSILKKTTKPKHAHFRSSSSEEAMTIDDSRRPSRNYIPAHPKLRDGEDLNRHSRKGDTMRGSDIKAPNSKKHMETTSVNGCTTARAAPIPATWSAAPDASEYKHAETGFTNSPNFNPYHQLNPTGASSNHTHLVLPQTTGHNSHYTIHSNETTGRYSMDPTSYAYSNSVSGKVGINYQPQVPDSSMGPMMHEHRVYGAQQFVIIPGAVCDSSHNSHNSHISFTAPLPQFLTYVPQPRVVTAQSAGF